MKTVQTLVLKADLPIWLANFQQQQKRKINRDGLDKVKVGVRHGVRRQLWLDKDEEAIPLRHGECRWGGGHESEGRVICFLSNVFACLKQITDEVKNIPMASKAQMSMPCLYYRGKTFNTVHLKRSICQHGTGDLLNIFGVRGIAKINKVMVSFENPFRDLFSCMATCPYGNN